MSVPLQSMVVEPAARLLMRRPNALLLKDGGDSELYLAFESREEREEWIRNLSQSILDLKVWGLSCDFLIPQPNSKFYSDSPSAHFVGNMRGSSVRGGSSLTQL